MPLFRSVPDAPVRIAFNDTTLVAANSDAPRATILTVPEGRRFTVFGIGTDQDAAAVDLIAFKVTGTENPQIVDMPSNRLSTDQRVAEVWEALEEGQQLVVGLRNGTGAGITPQLVVHYIDEPR